MQNDLIKKLFNIQLVIENPEKTTDGFNYKFSPLDVVLDLIKPHLEKQKLLLIQRPLRREDRIGIHTEIVDVENPSDKINTELVIELDKKNAQAVGSALSYCRRYSLLALFNLSPVGSDEDGNATLETPNKIERKW